MFALLTHHGTVVCRPVPGGPLVHRPVGAIPPGEAPALFLREGDALRAAGDGGGVLRVLEEGRGRLALSADQGPLTAVERSAEIASLGARIREHERFVPVSGDGLALIAALRERAWVVRTTRELIEPGAVRLVPGPALEIGRRRLDLALALPHVAAGEARDPQAVTLFFDGWKVDELLPFRPLVFFVAFGQDWVFDRLAVALNALGRLGKYRGDVLVIGDRSAAEIAALAPDLAPAQIHVQPMRAEGFVEFCAARYRVADWPDARAHAPLLYMDVDVVVDRPIEPFLAEVAVSGRMSAQREDIAPLARSRAAGARLFAEDGLQVGPACGFNSGIIGIPSLAAHGRTLAQIEEAIRLYARHFGKDALSHFDQALANYVTFKLARVDDEPVTSRVRYTKNGLLYGGPAPLGFVHFWGSGARTTRIMAKYVRAIDRGRPEPLVPAPPDEPPAPSDGPQLARPGAAD